MTNIDTMLLNSRIYLDFISFQWHPTPVLLPGKSQGAEELGRLQSMGSLRVGHDFTFIFTFHFHALEKEMATHSSILGLPW